LPDATILRAVCHLIDREVPLRPARVLDLSCGEGQLLEILDQRGFQVEGTHFRSDDYIINNPAPILRRVLLHDRIDLSQPLPFADGSYDVVTATEVLEHLPAHAPVIAEISRILKPGGVFISTTPNLHRMGSRLSFFFSGIHNQCGSRLGWHISRGEIYSTHYNPVYFPVFHSLLHLHGLDVVRLATSKRQLIEFAMIPLWPLVAMGTLVETYHFWRRSRAGGRDLFHWLLNPHALMSGQLCVAARKVSN
jgi:SAM-dependent methyltransferase